MWRFRPRHLVRFAVLLAAPLLVWFGSSASALADCEHFTPFGQPVHRSLADDVGVSAPPEWTVICHVGQVVLSVTLFRRGFLGLFLIDRGSICHIDPSSSES